MCPLSLKYNNSSLKSTQPRSDNRKEDTRYTVKEGIYAAEGVGRRKVQGRTQGTVTLTHLNFLILLDRRVVCFAGNLVRWEILNKKGKGTLTSLKELNLRVHTVKEGRDPHQWGPGGYCWSDFLHGFQALLL